MVSPWGGGPGSLGVIDSLENYQGVADLLSTIPLDVDNYRAWRRGFAAIVQHFS